jgi:VanZ family protein
MAAHQRSRRHAVLLAGLAAYSAVAAVYAVVPAGTPGTGLIRVLPGRDLAAHALVSGGLALLLCHALSTGSALAAVILAGAYAVVLELVQAFLPWRTCSLNDMTASLAGILLAVCGWAAARRFVGVRRAET